jgi:hypothetical protein
MLTPGGGYCPTCAAIGTQFFGNNMVVFNAVYNNTDYCQDCFVALATSVSQNHTCHRRHRARHDDAHLCAATKTPSSLSCISSTTENDDDASPASSLEP